MGGIRGEIRVGRWRLTNPDSRSGCETVVALILLSLLIVLSVMTLC